MDPSSTSFEAFLFETALQVRSACQSALSSRGVDWDTRIAYGSLSDWAPSEDTVRRLAGLEVQQVTEVLLATHQRTLHNIFADACGV